MHKIIPKAITTIDVFVQIVRWRGVHELKEDSVQSAWPVSTSGYNFSNGEIKITAAEAWRHIRRKFGHLVGRDVDPHFKRSRNVKKKQAEA